MEPSCNCEIRLHRLYNVCIDDVSQLPCYRSAGYFRDIPNVYVDLAQIAVKQKLREDERKIGSSVDLGIAVEDTSVALKLREGTKKLGIEEWLQR
jgi:hypothetical protein